MNIPVYKSKNFDYIRIKDLPEGYERLELEQWMRGQTQPLIYIEGEGDVQDAIFVWDYNRFLDYKAGKEVLVSP